MIVKAENLYYLQKKLVYRRFRKLARLCAEINRLMNGVEIGLGAEIGEGLTIHHGVGLVIGGAVHIGSNFHCFQNTSIGAQNLEMAKRRDPHRSPTIGDNVIVYPHTVIFGDLHVGDNVTIGAHCVVSADVPADSKLQAGTVWR